MQFQTDFKLAGPLAGLYGGITQAQEEEGKGLLNAYQSLKNQEQQYTSAEAQAKLQDPNYIKMKLENDISKFGKDMEMNKLEQGYNMTTRALTDLKVATAQGPQVLQQKTLGYMQQLGIDPKSQEGQMILQDPVGFAEKTQQFYASAATQNSDYQQKFGLIGAKGAEDRQTETLKGKFDIQKANISAGAQLAAADRYARGDMIKYSGQIRGELDNLNNNLTKIDSKEAEAAIIQDFVQRNQKNPTPQDIAAKKSELRTALENRKRDLETELDSVRGEVRGKLGMKQSGTKENPIKL